MARIVVTAEVEDSAAWEASYRTRGELLASMGTNASHFSTDENNEIAIYSDVEDVGKYKEVMESQATADAMAQDGVKRETVKMYVLDKEFSY
jgi:hypothetical protein